MIPAIKSDPNDWVKDHFIDRLCSVDASTSPFPHVYVTRCFPEDYYQEMLESLPDDDVYTDRTFENRMMCHAGNAGPFWANLSKWMLSWDVIKPILDIFPIDAKSLRGDVRLVRDTEGYKIKPHTDIKAKAISFLFYLARDDEDHGAGTTVMVPKKPGFTSDGTRRYEFEDFHNVYTAPFARNSGFGFPRSDVSFHGVEPTTMKQRDVLLLNIYK